jgi:hypothetical protein
VHLMVVPLESAIANRFGACGVATIEAVEQAVPEDNSPPVGHAGGIAFNDGHIVAYVAQLHQDGEVQAGGPAPGTNDLHELPNSLRRSLHRSLRILAIAELMVISSDLVMNPLLSIGVAAL